MASPEIFSIGHSNHAIDAFIELLHQHGIKCVVDVRTAPYSRFSPHFRREKLQEHLDDAGIDYIFLGQQLGGRPNDPDCYDDAGNVDYRRVARMDWYHHGVDQLISIADRKRSVMMCSEENPAHCHRNLLIADTLMSESRATVQHIRGDGRLERATRSPKQPRLF